jgi:hypothetical protein
VLDGNVSTDTSQRTTCSPLRDIHNLANTIKSLKGDPNQILVAGIFGWPLSDADMATAEYKIEPVPNPNTADTAHPTVFDYWPVCYDPNHLPTNPDPATGADPVAASFGATGGLRMSAFIDEFNLNGLKYSICQPDFAATMADIGNTLSRKLQNICLGYRLLDTDLNTPGLQPDCHVAYAIPDLLTGVSHEGSAMPQCQAAFVNNAQPVLPCWELQYDISRCPGVQGAGVGQLVNVVTDPLAPPVPAGTKIDMQCRTCSDVAAGASAIAGCNDY